MSILVIAEHNNSELHANSHSTYAAAQAIGGDIDILVVGHDCGTVIEEAKALPNCKKILQGDGGGVCQ